MTVPAGNSEFYFPSSALKVSRKQNLLFPSGSVSLFPLDANVPLGFASRNIEGLGETKLTPSLGVSH